MEAPAGESTWRCFPGNTRGRSGLTVIEAVFIDYYGRETGQKLGYSRQNGLSWEDCQNGSWQSTG